MTPHRKETNFVNDQPVRFYKFVALAFLLITIALFAVIIFMSAKRATITIMTSAESVEASKMFTIGAGGDYNSELVTTTIKLTKDFSPTGSQEKPGIATGVVMLHNDGNEEQSLIVKTRLQTSDGILFRLKNRVTVPAKGQIEAEVYADQEGGAGNIGPTAHFSVPGLSADKQKLIYASSDKPMSGGVKTIGILSEDDVKKAEIELAAGLAEKAKMELQALSPDNVLVFVLQDKNINKDNLEIGKEVDGFSLTGQALAVGAFYNDAEMKAAANEVLKTHLVGEAELLDSNFSYTVNLDNYDLGNLTGSLKLTATGRARLNAESKQLDKIIFFGKTQDEVRRYLLSLDHVKSVEIKFSPIWTRTIPHVADHVSVVVKESE